ncbi:NBS-LRR resistance-like protein [Gossypium australe]|uniref:NBS-LRR resistance-like protein n=1 Tax=Gossypium australe TaxID=47621 RepID=A0A5B6VK77_9ROSI|nr:NBS-LRR resistance-like protein [Gossypium australe]
MILWWLRLWFEELVSPMLLEFARKEQLHNHFNNRQTILLKIQSVLEDEEDRQFIGRFVKILLNELKDLAYDIKDVLDDFSTMALRQKSKEESQTIIGKIRKYIIMGGLGKTTLAQLVYNDDRVKTFSKLGAWVYVSEEFGIVRVMKTLLKSLTSRASDVNDLNELQLRAKGMLSKNRFLIVLDDVWNENYNDWMALRSPFEAGSPKSKIIVNTRNQQVESMMGTVSAYHLKEMSKNSDKLPDLRLSYYYLPSHLKQCFAYCSLFPNDYEFQKDEVVHLWIAEGFIHQPKGMKKVEDLDSEYFHELLSQLEDKANSNGQYNVSERVRHSSFIRQKYDVFRKFEPVYKTKDVRVANLKEKRGLDDLVMKWSSAPNDIRNAVDEFEVPVMLEAHQNLKKTPSKSKETQHISLPKGLVYNGSNSITRCHLERLAILRCPSLLLFPADELLAALKHLEI